MLVTTITYVSLVLGKLSLLSHLTQLLICVELSEVRVEFQCKNQINNNKQFVTSQAGGKKRIEVKQLYILIYYKKTDLQIEKLNNYLYCFN